MVGINVSHACSILENTIAAGKELISAIFTIVKFTSHFNIGNESVDRKICKTKKEQEFRNLLVSFEPAKNKEMF